MIHLSSQEINKKNPIFVEELTLKNYRTYKDLTVKFTQNIHTLVGPNECGKTNMLLVFELFNNPQYIKETDICCFSDNVVCTEPEIKFRVNTDNLTEIIPELEGNDLYAIFKGNKLELDIPQIEENQKTFDLYITSKLPTGQVHIQLPLLQDYLGLTSAHIEGNKEYRFTPKSVDDVEKIKQYIESHNQRANIEFRINGNSTNLRVISNISNIIKEIKIINWEFKKELYIPSIIPFSSLESSPDQYKSIYNIFKIANVEIKDLTKTTDHNRKINILRQVNERVSEILNESWTQYQNLKLNLTLGSDNTLHIAFLEKNRVTDPNTRSLGFQWFFAFLLYFNANFGNELKNYVILLDEPGIHLHPGGQRDLLKEIEKLALYNQIIYTTHLPFMINRNHPERIIYLNKIGGLTVLKKPRKEGIFDDILLANTLGFSFSSISNFGEVNLFVEGITDKILIEELVTNYSSKNNKELLDLNYISIVPINGISNLDSFIRVAQESKINFLVLLDNDEKGLNKYNKYTTNLQKYGNAGEFFFILEKDKEIEDLIPFKIAEDAFNDIKHNIEPWNFSISEDIKLGSGGITLQFKQIIQDIKENNSLNSNQTRAPIEQKLDFSDIDVRKFKLDFMLSVKKLVNEENCEDFKDLIKILKEINSKGFEIIKTIRELS